MFGNSLGCDSGEARSPGLQGFRSACPQKGISVVGFYRGIHQRAAARDQPGSHVDEVVDHFLKAIDAMVDIVNALKASADGLLPGIVKRGGSQFLLARKMTVDSTFLETCGGHQVRKGSALEAFLIEQGGGLAHDCLFGLLSLAHRASLTRAETDWSFRNSIA